LQIARISTTLLVCSRRHPQHFQRPAPSHIPSHAPRPPRRSVRSMENRDGRMIPSWDFQTCAASSCSCDNALDTMEKGGFKGPLSVEIEFRGDPWPPLREVNRAMKASYDKLTSL